MFDNLPIAERAAIALIVLLFVSFITAAITIGISNCIDYRKAKRALKYNKSAAEQIKEQMGGLKK